MAHALNPPRHTHASPLSLRRCHSPPLLPAQVLRRAEDGRTRCRRFGCTTWYTEGDPVEDSDAACVHHVTAPVFHEGFKAWGCCPSRRSHDFDEFMAVPGCATGRHSSGAATTTAAATPAAAP